MKNKSSQTPNVCHDLSNGGRGYGLASVTRTENTVPFQSIRQSRVTGLPKSTKCHDCHGHFGEVTKSFGDHMPNIEIFRHLRRQTAEIFVHVTAKLGGCRNHIFIRCITRHGT